MNRQGHTVTSDWLSRHGLLLLMWLGLVMSVGSPRDACAFETFLPPQRDMVIVKNEFIADPQKLLTVDELRQDSTKDRWQPVLADYANFGYQPHPYWYRFTLSNPRPEAVEQIIELSYPLLDDLTLYQYEGERLIHTFRAGDRLPYAQREIAHPHFLFPIRLESNAAHTFYLRVNTVGAHLVPINLWEPNKLFLSLSKEDELHGIYFGVVLVIVMFNLMIFVALREKLYLYYAVSCLLFMLFFAIMRAKLYPYFWSDSPAFHHLLLLLLPPSCLLFATLFSSEFLAVRKYSKRLPYLINGIIATAIVCLIGVFVLDSQTSLQLSVFCTIPGTLILLLLGPMIGLMGNRAAWVYTLAWGIFMFGTTVTAMSKQGFLPSSFITEFGMQLGSALEIFILNAALAYRFYREREDKLAAQDERMQAHNERRAIELELLRHSMSDAVTMMPNRACFEQQIQHELEHRGASRIAVCIIAITRYPEISKTLGHHNTELMLCEAARRYNNFLAGVPGLKTIHGPSFEANLCSLENGLFGIVVNADQAEVQAHVVNNIIRRLIQPIKFKEMRLELHPVIGVAICPEHGLNAVTLLRHAQVAADSSEAFERHVSYYKPEHDQYNTRRLTIISELKDAIKRGHLELYFQPKFDLREDRVTGVEALLRWHHERYGLVRPDDFIAKAEQTGIIKPLTRWVIDHALEQQAQLSALGYDLTMSINLSIINLRERDLVNFLEQRLTSYGVKPENVILELTETSMMQYPLEAIEILEKIRSIGINISIDDFGSGYSSLAYLRILPANEIKIDKSLIIGMSAHSSHQAIVKATIAMCHELGFTVVAEGVENQQVMDLISNLGCDLAQGYLLTPPLSFAKLTLWLEQQATRRYAS